MFQTLSDEEIRRRAAYRKSDRIWFWVKVAILTVIGTCSFWKYFTQ